ncbi:MAG: 23S rRNA (guanosine(2251)-2'-O)-methyltransferase RlmB [Clostridiaceae bacterium]|jgi:23S rRNA (guanosine2251-2'-O)-methyltransferase|nr:23S rRNA (guanosine(2251)-2'-O)-methyltransferase RlmB [Clostridiaceae bacterium]
MLISGKNSVKEALLSGKTCDKVYILSGNTDRQLGEIVRLAKDGGARVIYSEKAALDKLAPDGRHQGAVAELSEYKYAELGDVLECAAERGEEPLILILDGVQDPMNLGAVLRSAECLGAHGVVIGKHRAVSVNETVVKTSAGAAEYVLCVKATNVNDVIRELKDNFFTVYAAEADGVPADGVSLKGSTAIVIGGEGEGVKRLTRELCDGVLSIPMNGKINSLNASVAAGIMLYECARQRKA